MVPGIMQHIVAIGGGRVSELGSINKEIIRLTGRSRPFALYIPTASKDALEGWEGFRRTYTRLGCRTDVLFCIRETPSRQMVRDTIGRADIIYVGGGNTLMMMRRWAFFGVDRELRRARERGAVLCGASAGAICWFDSGHSDSMRGYGHDPWEYIRVSGLGFVPGMLCPHYHHKDRRDECRRMVRQRGMPMVAVDDHAAVEVIGDRFRILTARRHAGAWVVSRRRGRVVERRVPRQRDLMPLAELL